MLKYIVKRVLLMLLTLFIITTICFMLVRVLPMELPTDKTEAEAIKDRWEALGYNKPLLIQYGIYLRNILSKWDFGTSWYISTRQGAWELISSRLPPTILVNLYSFILSVPIGLGLGILCAVGKNKWYDYLIGVVIILFVSVPSYVYAFLVQYLLGFKLSLFPLTVYSLSDAGGWLTPKMFYSMLPAVFALSFGEISSLCRITRAELGDSITQDYMLLSRAKGMTRGQAIRKHAMRNAMVPILPMLISAFVGIIGGSVIIEQIFSIPGVGQLYVRSITLRDYDVFMLETILYTFVGLLAEIAIDISYGIIDPRIRIGEQ